MKPANLKYLDVDETLDWITNADRKDIPSKYLIDGRGIRNTEQGFVFQRDYGTQQRRASYPTPSGSVTATMRKGAAMKFKDFTSETDIVVCLDSNTRYHLYQYDGVGTGGWTHLNESYTAQINATPSASATTVVLKTLLDAFGNTPTIADDDFNEFFIWNISADIAITLRAAYITDTAANGATPSITLSVIAGSNGLGWAADQYVVIYRSTGVMNHLAPTARVASPSADNLGDYKAYDFGATATYDLHAQFLPTESLNKCVVMLGQRLKTTEVTTMKTPLRVQYDASRPFFYDTNAAALINPTDTQFWCEEGFGALETDCQYGTHTYLSVLYGDSPSNPIKLVSNTTPSGTITVGETGRQWLQVAWAAGRRAYEVTAGRTSTKWGFYKVIFRVAVTVLYDDYQESDPIMKWYFNYDSPVDGTGTPLIPYLTISGIKVNYALMNKNITGLRWYVDVMADNEIIQAGYPEADSNYTYFAETNFCRSQINALATTYKSVWTATTTSSPFVYQCVPAGWERTADDWYNYANIDCGYIAENAMFGLSSFWHPLGGWRTAPEAKRKAGQEETIGETVGVNMSSSLGHATTAANRAKFKPLFAVASNRIAGSIIIAAENDTTLRMTHYDGFGAHNDEVFPDVTVDNTGAVTKVNLSGKGRMYGLGVLDSVVYIFRRNFIETYDLHSGVQRIFEGDCISPDGIVFSQDGILWAGSSDIYAIFRDSSQAQVISGDIHNLWIGAKAYTTAPIITMAAKKACVSGFDPAFREAWFSLLYVEDQAAEYCVLRYSLNQRKWLPPRSFGTTGVQVPLWLMNSPTDAIGRRMVIGMSDRMLMYPSFLAAGVPLYLDNIASTVTTDDDSGDEFRLWGTVNIGEIYSMVVNAALYDIIVDTSITYTSGQGADVFTIQPFVNDETTALGTWSQTFNSLPFTRKLTPRGQIEALTIKIMAAVTQNHKKFEVRKITLGLVESGRIGNR